MLFQMEPSIWMSNRLICQSEVVYTAYVEEVFGLLVYKLLISLNGHLVLDELTPWN